jgi:uncharacterized coiled-coil protein SlyX
MNWTAVGAIAAAMAALIGVATFAGEGKKVVGELRGVTGRIGTIETRLQILDNVVGLGNEVETIESRLQLFDTRFDRQLAETGELKGTLNSLERTVSTGFQDLKASIDKLSDTFDKRLDLQEGRLEKRIDRLENRWSAGGHAPA